ncbi:MAG: hypothetical protein H0X39_06105 [Actinobacteria bacterium]|nr:hypothetical protein [Actinomycetota bacterium]
MLDRPPQTGGDDREYVEFAHTGTTGTGPYRCSGCGYGVTVRTTLPRCPMCSGEQWQRPTLSPFEPPRLQ